jgi:DNA end-binding protein Ku
MSTMRAIWKGTISFGLVSIPVSLFPAMHREELSFRLLRRSDQSPVNYKRVAAVDGKEVPWDQIVKGYEYEKGKFVVLKEEDFKRVDLEAAQAVDIVNFVELEKVNPLLFYKPYYMEVGKGGDKAYSLLREALVEAGKIGIAKVVIKTRQHLAAVKPQENGLMLELMHFPAELIDAEVFKAPKAQKVGPRELKMAQDLITSMSTKWEPESYHDDYHEALEEMIEEKLKHRGPEKPVTQKRKAPSNVIDLVSVIQESINASKGKTKTAAAKKKTKAKAKTRSRKKAA